MSMLRIVTGYTSDDHREETPEVLYIGRDADAARKASDEAGPQFVRIELIENRGGQRLRKRGAVINGEPLNDAAVRAALGGSEPAGQPAHTVTVPTLEEVMGRGYPEDSAKKIIARVEAQKAAQIANPNITREELEKIEAPVEESPALQDLTVAQLKEKCEAGAIDTTGFRVKADYIAALELEAEEDKQGADLAGKASGEETSTEGDDGPRL